MENGITRRGFLRGLFGGAAVAAVAPILLVPERKIWAVGAKLAVATPAEMLAVTGRGLWPVEGQPGLFKDMSTGQYIKISKFVESDAYSTSIGVQRPSRTINSYIQSQRAAGWKPDEPTTEEMRYALGA